MVKLAQSHPSWRLVRALIKQMTSTGAMSPLLLVTEGPCPLKTSAYSPPSAVLPFHFGESTFILIPPPPDLLSTDVL